MVVPGAQQRGGKNGLFFLHVNAFTLKYFKIIHLVPGTHQMGFLLVNTDDQGVKIDSGPGHPPLSTRHCQYVCARR